MSRFDDYSSKYSQIKLERRNGILQMTLHTDGAPVRWGPVIQAELVDAFTQIGADRDNRIIILAGTGNEFSGPRAEPGYSFYREVSHHITANLLDTIHWNAHRLMTRMLDIEVPMIAVVNGPAMRHSELPLMCDIVIASDDASFEDTAHFKLASQTRRRRRSLASSPSLCRGRNSCRAPGRWPSNWRRRTIFCCATRASR
jgi:enoyl-CoA hydratase/carnithine racemase